MSDRTVIGVDLGGTKVSVGAVVGDDVCRIARREISSQAAADVVLAEITETITEVFDDSVAGIGCGVPSVVDVEEGIVLEVENIPSWKRVPLRAELEARFGVPVTINNDANAFVVGEHVFGKGKGYKNLVGMTLGTGLGTGVIIDGRLYSGTNCGAGEIGMMTHKGLTLEAWCSGQFFPRECGAGGEEVYLRAQSGDAEALTMFERFGSEFAEAVMIALLAYDPEAIVLGGSISSAFHLFEGGLRQGLANFAFPHILERTVITNSDLKNAAIQGAAALFLESS